MDLISKEGMVLSMRTLQRKAWLSACVASAAAVACRTIYADGGQLLPHHPPPTSWDMISVTIVLLAAWLGAVVAMGRPSEIPDDRGGKPG